MRLFKSEQQLIAEIHNEFDTAQDRLLQQAKSFLEKASTSRVEEVGTRLAKVGFINSPTAKKAAVISQELVKSEEEANLINYYKNTYPFLKFLTEEELNRICEKYDLIHAPVGNYIEEVPEKNLRDIEIAQNLKNEDSLQTRYLFKLTFESQKKNESLFLKALGKTEPIFTRDELYNLVEKYYNKAGADSWVGDMSNFSNTAFWVISEKLAGVTQQSYYDSFETISKDGLFIAAPSTHFNLEGLSKRSKHGFFSVLETKVKDPIVFRYVRGGVQVITKWGLEASDPALVVEKLN